MTTRTIILTLGAFRNMTAHLPGSTLIRPKFVEPPNDDQPGVELVAFSVPDKTMDGHKLVYLEIKLFNLNEDEEEPITPQDYLQLIIVNVNYSKTLPHTLDAQRETWDTIREYMQDLVRCLQNGDLPPVATGPIFGTTETLVNRQFTTGQHILMGMSPRELPVGQVQTYIAGYDLVICVVDEHDQTCRDWMLVVSKNGKKVHRWLFPNKPTETEATHGPASLPATDH